MTRAERAANKEATLKARRAALSRELAQAQSRVRSLARAERARRHRLVGTMLDDCGLLSLSDAELQALFMTIGGVLRSASLETLTVWIATALAGAAREAGIEEGLALVGADVVTVQ